MVRIEKDKVVVEIEYPRPSDCWLDMMRDLIRIIQATDKEKVYNYDDCIYGVCDLLEALLPDENTARKMIED